MEPDFSKVSPPTFAAFGEGGDPRLQLDKAMALHNAGQLDDAAGIYRAILAVDPGNFDALHLLGVVALQSGRFADSADLISKALIVLPHNAAAHFNHGMALTGLKQYQAALAAYDACLRWDLANADAWNNRGYIQWLLGQYEHAAGSYARAVNLRPDFPGAHNNRGAALAELGYLDAALASYDMAIAQAPDFADAHNNRGTVLRSLHRHKDALAAFDKSLALNPQGPSAWNNRGLALADLNQTTDTLAAYDRAIRLMPNYAEAYNNRANALVTLKLLNDALADYDTAIRLKPDYADAYANRAAALVQLKRLDAAVENYDAALKLNPAAPFVAGARLHAKMLGCDWSGFNTARDALAAQIEAGDAATATFPLMALIDSPALQRKAAETWTRLKSPPMATATPQPAPHDKIRIGYFSMDFRQHAVATLTAGLFEAHDRSKFEVYGFSFGPNTGDEMHRRLQGAFDKFIDVRENSDTAAVVMARDLGLDIAIDLAGHTKGARPGIFALGAAPVQAGYLGYPGTMGADYIDYLIADAVVIPPQKQDAYNEKIVRLPCFQANDRKRLTAGTALPRTALGLPSAGFVFCCFNAAYKITPETFDSWMRILSRVAGSVLLLSAGGAAVANLKKEAAARNIDPARLVFCGPVSDSDYLARFRTAGLFLDTLPFNAHTTASDALWAGLPVLTRIGEGYAARVAASLLTSLGLTELITTTAAAYEDLAVALATDPERLARTTETLAQARLSAPLFDTAQFTAHIENAYSQMIARHRAGLAPDHIHVA